MTQNTTKAYLSRVQLLHKNTTLPTEVITFIENFLEIPEPQLRKKLSFSYDALQHSHGKSILQRQDLYPYKTLAKVEERLLLLASMEFASELQGKTFVQNIRLVHEQLAQDKKFAKKLLIAYLEENEEFYQKQAEISSEFAFMCYFLAYFAFIPFFAYTRSQIEIQYDDATWQHGHCPYCGSAPHLSYLKGKEGQRLHACPTCTALYRVPRIQCPYCLEQRQEKLKYFTSDSVKEAQVCVCTQCNTYLKICDMREYEKFTPLPYVDDFKTILLDIVAQQQNFSNPTLSLWLS